MSIKPFSGSYPEPDVTFLLTPLEMEMTDVKTKEALIQSGKKHYSEMLSLEKPPSKLHLDIFDQALELGGKRMAKETLVLARALSESIDSRPLVLVSLVRAGVPMAVSLMRALRLLDVEAVHYGISIIRDRGIDTVALDKIEAKHGTEGICFIDGWTGKGAIAGELSKALINRPGYPEKPRLVVLADPGGCSWLAASGDDWLIPFGVMGAPVSGLVSRSVWHATGLHGCVVYDNLLEYDCSSAFVDQIEAHMKAQLAKIADVKVIEIKAQVLDDQIKAQLQTQCHDVIDTLAKNYKISSINRIKPGIAEATRAVMRRVPEHVLVRDKNDADVQLLLYLAEKVGASVTEVGHLTGNYRAITIIKQVV
ncbi:MAG: cysteine protease StiP family protein [Psychromonas sp.]|nr:cysteine protease StiP family protein [Alteromonadales bacterium]MCP5078669.1 cysteine protease StiP family protein [Psychromonas sp.]